MIFSELYSAYYNTVARILGAAVARPLDKNEMRGMIEENAFGESILYIGPAIASERWQLVRADGTTPIRRVPTMPLTTLEKRWLKAICADPRMRLFTDDLPDFPDVEPLFGPDDVSVFDAYSDGDPYDDEAYVGRFRLILEAIRQKTPLDIRMKNRKGGITRMILTPEYLEYSEKDDKFRLIGSGNRYGGTVNLQRIVSCEPYDGPFRHEPVGKPQTDARTVEFELVDQRNALERALLHFAHFEKQARRLDDGRYEVKITYDKEDEAELVIRILSFGPLIKVTSPGHFVELIKDRLKRQIKHGSYMKKE